MAKINVSVPSSLSPAPNMDSPPIRNWPTSHDPVAKGSRNFQERLLFIECLLIIFNLNNFCRPILCIKKRSKFFDKVM